MRQSILEMLAKSEIIKHYAKIASSPFLIAMAILDICIVVFSIYYIYKRMKNTRISQLVKGILILILLTLITSWLQLFVSNKILSSIIKYGALAIIIIFQPEIRKTLENIGKTKLGKLFGLNVKLNDNLKEEIYEIMRATEDLAKTKTGALIVFEKDISLDDIIKTGVSVDAKITAELLKNIFFINTPLHDGAVIIKNGRIEAASCILPLSNDNTISQSYGTRHRAALGVSTTSDAIALVVSEETGKISIAKESKIQTGLSTEEAKKVLLEYLNKTDNEKEEINTKEA